MLNLVQALENQSSLHDVKGIVFEDKNSKEIVELLRQFNKALNQTVIIITHDERIALDADRVIAVEDGKIVKDEVIRQ